MTSRKQMQRHRDKLVPGAVALIGLIAVSLFWRDITAWFTGQPVDTVSGGSATTVQAGPFQVEAVLAPDPPRERGNSLRLRLTEGGSAVDDAKVRVAYRMPPMGAMQEMRGDADVETKGDGRYAAKFDLAMAGSWALNVTVDRGGRSVEATFNITVGARGLTATGQGTSRAESRPAGGTLPSHEFDAATLERVRAAFVAYERARALLAHDSVDGLDSHARAITSALEAAAESPGPTPSEISQRLSQAAEAARRLGEAADATTARHPFGELSRDLVALAAADPRLTEGLHIFKCPMAEGFQKWFQPPVKFENPYMGQRMLECGVRSDWSVGAQADATHAHQGGDEIAYYTCSMHPSVKQKTEGTCPICAMDLTPVTQQEVETGTIFVDEVRRQRIGVRTAAAERQNLTLQIRAVGQVRYDETRLFDVNLRMSGWVHRLQVEETGQRVRKGQTLFTLYSPELYAAQQELLTSVRRHKRHGEGTSDTLASLTRASRQRLRLLGMADAQIAEIERRGEAWENIPLLAPSSGFVLEKNVVEGARVESGALVYRIADLSRVWIDAEVYESDLPHVRVGQQANVRLPHVPNQRYRGKVDYIYPTLQRQTRTGRVRVVLDNHDLALKPEMYATVEIEVDLGERLVVPDSAVIYTGPRRLVFVDLGEGRLRPKVVQIGVHAAGYYEVTDGLDAGEVVVTSGNFLIAAESRIRSAAGYWESSHASE